MMLELKTKKCEGKGKAFLPTFEQTEKSRGEERDWDAQVTKAVHEEMQRAVGLCKENVLRFLERVV